jgi:RHS repeat-associated protein
LPFGQADVIVGTVDNNLRFAGQYYDAETGLHYNYHRYYDPKIGRYLRADPIGLAGGFNLYTFVNNNPGRYIDKMGLAPCSGGARKECEQACCDRGGVKACDEFIFRSFLTGQELGRRVACLCNDDYEEMCDKVVKWCRAKCTDLFVENPDALPGTGRNYQGRLRRCIRECAEQNGCSNY